MWPEIHLSGHNRNIFVDKCQLFGGRCCQPFKIQNAGVSEMFVFVATLHGLTLWENVMMVFTCVQVSDGKEETPWRGPWRGGGGAPSRGTLEDRVG
jgi:hypothetical protein